MKALNILATGLVVLSFATDAEAFCRYGGKHFTKGNDRASHGRLYATTTQTDELLDAALVVKGTVLSSHDVSLSDPDEDSGVIYRVRVDRTFKGHAPRILRYFSERDSGGFYLDTGVSFLLFLNPIETHGWVHRLAPGTWMVNYSCGKSRPWREVSHSDTDQLVSWASHTQHSN